jgi:hypothetical protein
MASATIQAPEAQEPVNSIGRIFGALFSPKATFESIVRRPTWLVPTIVLSILFLAVVGTFSHRGGWPSFFEKQLSSNSRYQQMPADQQQRMLEAELKYGPPVAYVEGFIVPALLIVIVAAVFFGVFNGLLGMKFSFKTSLGITAHAWVPQIISGLLGVLIILIKDPSTIDLQNLVASNAGAFLSSESPKWMVSLLSSFDLFAFWTIFLLALGYSLIPSKKKLSLGAAFFYIFGVWLVWVLVKAGAVAAFS